jgi:hypothetical protein
VKLIARALIPSHRAVGAPHELAALVPDSYRMPTQQNAMASPASLNVNTFGAFGHATNQIFATVNTEVADRQILGSRRGAPATA